MDANPPIHRWLWGVLTLALVVRLGAAVALQLWLDSRTPPQRFVIAGDAEGYWDLAGDLAAGREYAVYTPPRRVLRMPGFPAVLAVARAVFGDRLFAARLWLACVGTLACWGVWRLGAELCDPATGLLAALLAALSPVFVLFTPVVLSETTFAAALLLSLIAGARLLRRHQSSGTPAGAWRTAAATGAGMALATYVRPSWLLVGPLCGGCLVLLSPHRRGALRDAAVLNLVLLAALLPWGVRNQHAAGHFTLTTFWMGPSLYDGLNPAADGDSDMAFFDRDNLVAAGYSEYEIDRHYRDAAWAFASAHPGRALELAVIKCGRYWKPWPNAEQFGHPLAALAVAASFAPALLLALRGGWLRRGDTALLLCTLGPILYFAAVHMVFVSSLRYRLPAEYPLLVLSAAGLRSLLPARWLTCCTPTVGAPQSGGA